MTRERWSEVLRALPADVRDLLVALIVALAAERDGLR